MSDPTRILRRDAPPARLAPRPQDPATPSVDSWRIRIRRDLGLAAMLIGVVAWFLSQRVPCGPSAGSLVLDRFAPTVSSSEPASLRLGTYNIHGGRGLDGVRDLSRIANVVRGLDFVGLNEVHGTNAWDGDDQASALGRELELTPLFTPTEERWFYSKFGNGLLTRLEVEQWQVVPLARRHAKSYRNLVHLRARAANGARVNLVVTHIDRSDDRERRDQLQAVAGYFLSLAEPAVLMGDLNSDASEPELQRLLEEPGTIDVFEVKPELAKQRHIDWIIVRGAKVADAGLVEAGPSDHPHVWAELIVPPAATSETLADRRK